MYSAPPPVPGNRLAAAKNAWPIAAICCLGILGFLIAITIVLALIPIYLPTKSATAMNSTTAFYVQYSAPATAATSLTGTVNNAAAIGQLAGLGTNGAYASGMSQATYTRRKRGVLDRREKRGLVTNFFFYCIPAITSGCNTQNCQNTVITALKNTITKTALNNIPVTITSSGVTSINTYTLTLVGFSTTMPSGFGTASSFNFTALQTGLFNNGSTWVGGIVPYGNATVIIPAGITVTIAGSSLLILVSTFYVSGTLAVGQGASSFTFTYPTTIIIQSGGTFLDLTSSKSITISEGSLITNLDGSTGLTSATTVTIGASSGKRATGDKIVMSGVPATLGVFNGFLSFPRINPICIKSGSFISILIYLGGFAPSTAICSKTGCGLYIPSGVTVTTAELNGVMSVRIIYLNIISGGGLTLGTPGVTGFKFAFPLQMDVYGNINFNGGAGSIQMPSGSAFNLYSGAMFQSPASVSFQTVDSSGNALGSPQPLTTGQTGPYYLNIPSTGLLIPSFTIPAGNSSAGMGGGSSMTTPMFG